MSECIKCGKPCVTDELEAWCPTCAANEIDRLAEVEVLAQAEIERLRTKHRWWQAENNVLRDEIERLRARWSYIKSHPDSARHLLGLLEAGRGSGDDFDKMIDRIVLALEGGWR